MAVQRSDAVRSAMLDAIETTIGTSPKLRILTGSPPANCAASQTGTLIVEIPLPSDWAAAASAGVKTWNAVTGVAATTGGTAGYYRIVDTAGTTCHEQGTCSATGGGGDIFIDPVIVPLSQVVNVPSWSVTMPGA